MFKSLQLQNCSIQYEIKESKRAKRVRLAVFSEGKIVVTLPEGKKEEIAEKYLIDKSKWLFSKINFYNSLGQKNISVCNEKVDEQGDKTLKIIKRRINYFNKLFGFKIKKIKVKKLKTRWGSCSKKSINFNFKIVHLPKNLRDYVIVHELCHLKEPNHSNRFWNLVAKAIPKYFDLNKEIKNKNI